MDFLFMDGGRENAIEMLAGAWLNGLSGGIAVPVGIASGPLLDKDGSEVCRILGCDFFRKYAATQIRIRTRRNLFFRCWTMISDGV